MVVWRMFNHLTLVMYSQIEHTYQQGRIIMKLSHLKLVCKIYTHMYLFYHNKIKNNFNFNSIACKNLKCKLILIVCILQLNIGLSPSTFWIIWMDWITLLNFVTIQFVINMRRNTGNIAVLIMLALYKFKISTLYFIILLRNKTL